MDLWARIFAKFYDRCMGCHCNRSTLQEIAASGFVVESVEHGRLPKAAPIVKPLIAGVASAPA